MFGYSLTFLLGGILLGLVLHKSFLWLALAGALGLGFCLVALVVLGLTGKIRGGWPLA